MPNNPSSSKEEDAGQVTASTGGTRRGGGGVASAAVAGMVVEQHLAAASSSSSSAAGKYAKRPAHQHYKVPEEHFDIIGDEIQAALLDPPSSRRTHIIRDRIEASEMTDFGEGEIDWVGWFCGSSLFILRTLAPTTHVDAAAAES